MEPTNRPFFYVLYQVVTSEQSVNGAISLELVFIPFRWNTFLAALGFLKNKLIYKMLKTHLMLLHGDDLCEKCNYALYVFLKAFLYLEVFACTALETIRLCRPHSSLGREAAHWLRYIQLGQKILRHLKVCRSDDDAPVLHHLPMPGGSDETILPFAFKYSSSVDPFDPQSVALFNLFLQWTKTEQVGQLKKVDADILLVEAWLTDKHPIETVVMVMKQLLERLKMRFEGNMVDPSIAHRFVASKLMPFVADLAVESQFDQVAFLLEYVRDLLESAFNRGNFLEVGRCPMLIASTCRF